MGKFIRLEITKLPEDFNLEKDTEKPLVQILKERDRQIKIDFIFPGFYLYDADSEIDGRQFQKISIYCTGSISEFGKPFLPSFGRYIQIPRNSLVSKTLFERGIEFKFQGLSLWPAQRGRYDQKPNEYDYNSGFYKANTFYPGEDNIVRVNGPYEMDGYRVVLVHITPFQYNPAKGELIGYGSVTLTLDLIRDEKVAELPEAGRLMAFGNLIINPAIGIEKQLGFPVAKGKKRIIPSGPEFLVIYGKKQNLDLEPAAKALKNWKEAKGITTDTILIDDLPAPSSCLASCKLQSPPANPSNCPLACKLKQYIRGRSGLNSLLKYVLLFGDADTIPTETAAEQVPSDYYYSTCSDQLSNQSDDLSRVFLPPQLSIGRIPVQTVDEAWIVVDKIKSYEQSPPPEGTGYYEKLTLTAYAGNLTPDLQAAEPDPFESVLIIQDRFQSCYTGINVEGIYQDSSLGTNVDNPPFYGEKAAVKALSSATKDGRMIIGYEGHGMPQYWLAPKLYASDLPTLQPYQPSILYSACCHVGRFNCGVDSFAESTLKTKGPVAAGIAATSNSYPITNHPLMQALFDATFGDILDIFPAICNLSYPIKNGRLGDILNYAKFFVQSRYPNELSYAVCELYHVIGDPTLEVWTAPPLTFNVNVTIVNNWLEFELSPCPNRCVLTLWEGNTILGKIITSAAPSVNFTMPCRHLTGQLKIGCWAPGYKYAEMPVPSPMLAPPSGLHIT